MSELDVPKVGSVWQHTNGTIYVVVCVANDPVDIVPSKREEFPVMISYKNIRYQGERAPIYGRSLPRWNKSMTPVPETQSSSLE